MFPRNASNHKHHLYCHITHQRKKGHASWLFLFVFFSFQKTYKLGKLNYAALNEQIKKLISPMSPLMHLRKSQLFFSETCFHKKKESDLLSATNSLLLSGSGSSFCYKVHRKKLKRCFDFLGIPERFGFLFFFI